MSPSNWNGVICLCAVVTALVAVFGKTLGAGAAFGSMAESMKNIEKTLTEVVHGQREDKQQLIEVSQKQVEHDLRIYNLEKGRAPDQRPGLDFRRRRGAGNDS